MLSRLCRLHQPAPAASQRPVLAPHYSIPSAGPLLTRHQRRFTLFTRPVFPLPVAPGWNGDPWAFPELRTPLLLATHVRVGTGHKHEPGPMHSTSAEPPICTVPHRVRPRVATSRKSVTGKSLAARLWKRAAYTGLCRGGVHQYAEFLTGFAPNPAQSGADHCVDAEHDALGDHVGPAPVPTLARAPKPGRVLRAAFPRARRVSPANLAATRGANASSSRWGRAPAAPRSVRVPGAP
jgi:hypothetical protein